MKKLLAVPFIFLAALAVLAAGILALIWLFAPRASPAAAGDIILGSGRVRTEMRAVKDFSTVVLSGAGELTIRQGDVESLTVEAEDNLLPMIEAQVRDGVLTLSIEPPASQDTLKPTRPIRYDLSVKDVSTLSTKGAGTIAAADIDTARLQVTINGSGIVSLAGAAARQEITISGGGQYRAADLQSREASVKVLGAGSAVLWVHDRLNISCTGVCAVDHYGSPVVTKELTPGSAVAWLGDK